MKSKHTNQIHNAISNTQSTSSLHTPPNILDISRNLLLPLQLRKELPRQRRETRHNIPSHQILRTRKLTLHRRLHLQLTPPKAQIHDLLHRRRLPSGQLRIVLGDLVPARDADVDAAFTDEGRDVGRGEEDERDGEVLDEGDIEAGFAAELHVAAGEEV